MSNARFAAALLSAALLSGCATYMEQRADVYNGGPERRVNAAQNNIKRERERSTALQDEQFQLSGEMERNQRRLAAADSELKTSAAQLRDAQARGKLSRAQYDRLRAENAALQSELSSLNLHMSAGAGSGNAAEVAAKTEQLRALERRKAELDRAVKNAMNAS